MYALPEQTLLQRLLPLEALYDKHKLSAEQRQLLEDDIERLEIVAQLSPSTLPQLAASAELNVLYLLRVQLRRRDYSPETVQLLVRLIPQRLLLVLSSGDQAQLALVHRGLHRGSWLPETELAIPTTAPDLEQLWAQLVSELAALKPTSQGSIDECLDRRQELQRLQRTIAKLERQIRREASLGRQMTLRSQVKELKTQLSLLSK